MKIQFIALLACRHFGRGEAIRGWNNGHGLLN